MHHTLECLLTDAIEGPGIAYWAEIDKVRRIDTSPYWVTGFAVRDGGIENDPVKTEWLELTEAILLQARNDLVSGKIKVRKDLAAQFVGQPDDWDYDAEGVDVLIQAAYFGELVYG